MTKPATPFDSFVAVGDLDGRLRAEGDTLEMLLPPDCPPTLKADIRRNKTALLELLSLNFLLVKSDALNAVCVWTPDEQTKSRLVELGASLGAIYTARELEILTNQRVTCADLLVIHQAKRTFDGRITNHE